MKNRKMITRTSTLITSSLLFGGNLNLNAGNDANTQTANIKADNLTQEVKQTSITSQTSTHTDIKPDYGKIAEGAAITGAIAGVAVTAGEYISQVKADYNKGITPEQAKLGKTPVSEGSSNLKSGLPSDSKIGVNVVKNDAGQWVFEGTKTPANWFEVYVTGSENPALKALNLLPGSPSFADFHDAALEGFGPGVTFGTIFTHYPISQLDACGAVCAGIITDNNIKVQEDTTTKSVLINN